MPQGEVLRPGGPLRMRRTRPVARPRPFLVAPTIVKGCFRGAEFGVRLPLPFVSLLAVRGRPQTVRLGGMGSLFLPGLWVRGLLAWAPQEQAQLCSSHYLS